MTASPVLHGTSGRIKVAITHVRLGWGGSEKRVLWGIQALKDDYEVTLITAGDFDLSALNRYYGTSLQPYDFNIVQAPLPPFMRGNARAAALRGGLFQRYCRRIADDYDVLVSGYGPMDFGRRAIHFIADFSWDDEMREQLHPYPSGLIYKDRLPRRLYLGLSRILQQPSDRDLFAGEDWMIAVSPWVAETMKSRHGVDCRVIPSPVPGSFHNRPLEERQWGFVCMGRLAPEKRIERIIEILLRVRARGQNLHLHVIGGDDNPTYKAELEKLCAPHWDWVALEGRLEGKQKTEILSQHRFGIHACEGDAFPGAVIEMMKAGCIVWTHRSGGQTEIIDNPRLLYSDTDDAVEKILQVLEQQDQQESLQCQLMQQAEQFSVERFMKQIRALVKEWCDG